MIAEYMARVLKDTQQSGSEYAHFSRSGVTTHPIPFFGDAQSAKVLTVGVNPSAAEFVKKRVWPAELEAIELADRLCRYFVSAPAPPHPWFRTWTEALAVLDISYREAAAHLDLSPRATVAMGSISNWQEFASMVERDARWFFQLLTLPQAPRLILIAGCVTKRWYIDEFIARIAPAHGYELKGYSQKTGEGRIGHLKLIGPAYEVPVFFCSVSPSGNKRRVLVSRVREHRRTLAGWLNTGKDCPSVSPRF